MSADHHMSAEEHAKKYVQTWAILLALLVVSVVGPMFEIPWLTLMTAFGIAVVKAYLVIVRFMHLPVESKYVTYMLVTMLAFMGLLFAGVAPDVMNHEGQRWENVAAKKVVEEGSHDTGGHH